MKSKTIFLYLSLIFTVNFLGCLSQESNQLGMGVWKGVGLETGVEVAFHEFPEEVLALNVYGLNCPPCWKEIAALNRIGERLSKDSRFSIVMIVDPRLLLENSADSVQSIESTNQNTTNGNNSSSNLTNLELTEENWQKAIEIMKRERTQRDIRIPIYLMKPPFQVSKEAFITGTPETILVRTKPWNIIYNFIGSISEKSDIQSIDNDPKVKFLLSMMGAYGL